MTEDKELKYYEWFVDANWQDIPSKLFLAVSYGGECGELLNEIKKEHRGKYRQPQIMDELGDNLYYLVKLIHTYGYTVSDIMKTNISKLETRRRDNERVQEFTPEDKGHI